MRVLLLFLIMAAVLVGAWVAFSRNQGDAVPHRTMEIVSSAFTGNQPIPPKYTCQGENVNPPLEIRRVPAAAKSVALIVDDPDAPGSILRPGGGQAWVHWVLWNIAPPDAIEAGTVSIKENGLPRGATQGRTSFNEPGYGGPCPPSGEHRYFFKAYALDVVLNLDPTSDKRVLMEAMRDHILDSAELIGRYRRS